MSASNWDARQPRTVRLAAVLSHRHTVAAATTLLLLVTLTVVMFTVLRLPLKDDVAWLLYVARRWMAGRELYTDLVEVNPPLIVWISAMPIRLSGWLRVPTDLVAMPFFIAIVLGCAWWTSGLLRGYGTLFAQRLPVFAVIGTVLLAVPGVEVGQREHLLIAAALPFLALFARELDGEPTRLPVAIAAGILAGLGCALKPRYAVVFVMLEGLALLRGRFAVRALTVSAVATLLAYGASILVFCPNYMRRAVPLALALYGATDVPALQLMQRNAAAVPGAGGGRRPAVAAPSQPAGAQPRAGAAAVRRHHHGGVRAGRQELVLSPPARDGRDRAGAAVPGGLGAGQPGRGWPRVWVPLLVAERRGGGVRGGQRQRLEPAVALAVTPERNTVDRLEALIRREKAKRYIAFSEWIALGFPVVNNTGVVWTSRFDSMWALKGELWRVRFDPAAAKEWPILHWVAHDFVAGCPRSGGGRSARRRELRRRC